ncbi:MAG: acdH, partial [Acidimicrobiaceae bacterium]|nr:acdH [Acidimicrobiaceae bacterium]
MTTVASGPAPAVRGELSEEHEELRRTVERFARAEIAPVIADYYERAAFPYPIIAKMGELGLFGLPFSEDVGGSGGDCLAFCLTLEELARVDSSVAITLEASTGLGAMLIYRFGDEDQRRRWLPALCSGEMLGAFGLTEPGGGSDAEATSTSARREGDEFVINGSKSFITNSGTDITGFVIITALTEGADAGERGISTIIVPAGAPGFSVAEKYSKVGWCASDTHELSFSDCRVPAANLLGPLGRGYSQFLAVLDEGRIAIAALSVGLAQGCLDECLGYVVERSAFGKKIGDFQAIQFKLADMAARVHLSRLAYYDAIARMERGEPFKMQAAIAKLTSSDAAMANAREATQIFGGYGFMNETPVARFYRDAKILEIGEGTSEVQRMVISRELLA